MSIKENIEKAIVAHTEWRSRVTEYVRAHEKIDDGVIETVGNDHVCDFGKWLYGPDTLDYRDIPEYEIICRLHKQFHGTAAAVCMLVNAGDRAGAEEMMNPNGQYPLASNKLILSLKSYSKMF